MENPNKKYTRKPQPTGAASAPGILDHFHVGPGNCACDLWPAGAMLVMVNHHGLADESTMTL